MQVDQDLTPEQLKAIGTIEKLLRLASRNTNEAEAVAAQSKAADLMREFNLDQAAVEENSGESGKRTDQKLKGGHFQWQRDLWNSVAALNFCLYFDTTDVEKVKGPMVPKDPDAPHRGFKRTWIERRVRHHRLVGRTVNVRGAKVMAEYLEGAIDRITEERLGERHCDKLVLGRSELYSKWANDFRSAAAERVVDKISERKKEILGEERKKAREAAARAREQGMEGATASTAVTVAGFYKSEMEANKEFLDPGRAERIARFMAEDAAARARQAEAQAEAEAEYAKWAAANPEAARLEEELQRKREEQERRAERRREQKRNWYYQRYGYSERSYEKADRRDPSARRAGWEAGDSISIEPQVDTGSRAAGRLG